MSKYKWVTISFTFVLIITAIFVFQFQHRPTTSPSFNTQPQNPTSTNSHPINFFEPQLFEQGIAYVENNPATSKQPITAATIPHHLIPSHLIADFFYRLAQQPVDTIILIGPNHHEAGSHLVLTSEYSWQTPFGLVHPDQIIISQLTNRTLINIDEQILVNEHSVAGIMPYLKHYLPRAQVVPIILSARLNLEQIQQLSNELTSIIKSRHHTAIVAAVDFSHYLTSQEAQTKDEITLQLIKERNYQALINLDDSHLDSPASIILLLQTLEQTGDYQPQILHHTNSAQILNDYTTATTSYFSIVF